MQAQSSRPQVFNSYLENAQANALFQEDEAVLRSVHGHSVVDLPKSRSDAVPTVQSIADTISKSKSTADEFEVQIRMLQDKLLANQMPPCGNLASSKRKEVKMRLKCITTLLQAREKAWQMKEQFQDKMRRLEMDKEIQEKKVAKLQKDNLELDRQKYQAELKAQESATSMRQMQKQTKTGVKEMIGQ